MEAQQYVTSLNVDVHECSVKRVYLLIFILFRVYTPQSNTGSFAQKIYQNSKLLLLHFFSSKTPVYLNPSRGTS